MKRSMDPNRPPVTDPATPVEPIEITAANIEEVVARMARIPAKQASSSDRDRLRSLEESLGRVVFGQEEAVGTVARAIKRARAGLGQPDRPAGCFLFTGPTGVGKTELAKQLALHLGNEFLRFDMSEYMEKHAVARLIGAPPGYVGFEQGGLLVDAVRQHPYAVVLLDEIEKAHADIFNILLQVMDHATLTDNNGRKADFRQVVLIMTSNAGSREMSAGSIGFAESGTVGPRPGRRQKASQQRSKQAIEKVFSPEFRNRLDAIVSFGPLTPAVMETIVEKFILQLEAQLAERRVAITLEPEARVWLAEKGFDPVYGARPLARVIQTEVRDPLTDEILFGRLEGGGTVTITHETDWRSSTFAVRQDRLRAPAPSATGELREQSAPWQTTSTTSPSRSSIAAGGRTPTPRRRPRKARLVAQADLRRGARAEGRREGQADPGVPDEVPPGLVRVRGDAPAPAARDLEGHRARRAARSSPSSSRSSTTSSARSTRRKRSPSAEALLQGVEMVRRQFLSKLEGLGVTPIDVRRRPFDPALHEAISTVPAASPDRGRHGRRRHPPGLSDRRRRAAAGGGRGGEESLGSRL